MKAQVFFDTIRATLFHGKLSGDQVAGIEGILAAMDAVGDGDAGDCPSVAQPPSKSVAADRYPRTAFM